MCFTYGEKVRQKKKKITFAEYMFNTVNKSSELP